MQFCGKSNTSFWGRISNVLPATLAQFKQDWIKYAPGYAYDELYLHEWERHGTCFSAACSAAYTSAQIAAVQTRYFANQMRLVQSVATPAMLPAAAASGKTVALSALLTAFGGGVNMTALSCGKIGSKIYLDSVFLCFGVNASGDPTERVQCPAVVMESSYDNSCASMAADFYVYPEPSTTYA